MKCNYCNLEIFPPFNWHERGDCEEAQKMIDYSITVNRHQQAVRKFMNEVRKLHNLPAIPNVPTIPNKDMIVAQAKLILEETLELIEACGLDMFITTAGISKIEQGCLELTRGDLDLISHRHDNIDICEVAKELADVEVVSTGMFCEFGLDSESILKEVDENNMAKLGPGSYLDSNRKLRKPPNHPKPDIKRILQLQGLGKGVTNETQEAKTVPV